MYASPERYKKGGSEGLHKWFGRNQGRGWADCKASKASGKFVPCGRKIQEKPGTRHVDQLLVSVLVKVCEIKKALNE